MISRRLEDGRILTVYPEIFGTARLLIDDNVAMHKDSQRRDVETESDGGADFYYQYESLEAALDAFHSMYWGDDEPKGWIRAAPPCFRRRPGGDPEKEFVSP